MPIYTKKGDKGETSVFSGKRVKKSSKVIRALGAIDEANSFIGLAISFLPAGFDPADLIAIQRNLFTVGSMLAGAKLEFPKGETKKLEGAIDAMDSTITPLKNFILPGGSKPASLLHVARTKVRSAERELTSGCHPEVLKYINRLSDYLFTLARFVNKKAKRKETFWIGRK